ncbi:vWA domain-containing protein [Haloarchaeobius iranensis]|uniref:von Willebrand factor type A domain-containing protein n=1 Tax=Haloarchaeobius iranensis TaxID=996166 RepID=A0A1G9ZXN8_9EURY|nr:vWA domain-containing protein [Haloarchaeobius iranensis]SDN26342.1 von Willebrand factor type A domain-containing protein [Haloarchaeobius iranensis]
MRGQGTSTARARGVSEITGLVLLIGIVIAGAAILFVSGSAVTETIQDNNEVESAEVAMSNVDSELGSLSMADSGTGQQLDLGSMSANDAMINRTGEIRVSVNDRSACAATVPLTALEYHHESGTTIVYESGAVWRADENGGVSQLSEPGVRFQDQTLQLNLVNLSGTVDDSTVEVQKNSSRSAAMTSSVRSQLFDGACGDPDTFRNLTLSVTSTYHEAWQRHLEAEFGASQVSRVGSETVEVEIPRSMLPPEYDNRRNTVVNFDDRLLTGKVVSEGTLALAAAGAGSGDDDVFAIDKGEGNTYESSLTLLGAANANATTQEVEQNSPGDPIVGWNNSTVTLTDGSTVELTHEEPVYEQQQRWNNWTEEVPTNETLEIVFVMDESGSMGEDSKMENAQDAANEFIDVVETTTNGTEPRYSVVGYTAEANCQWPEDWYEDYHRGENRWVCESEDPADVVQHHPLNTDEQGAHDAIAGLEPQASTPISQSIEEASEILQNQGNSSNEQFIVLLTDGKHNIDDDPNGDVRWPDEAAAQDVPDGVTLHSVGFGNPDDTILEATADATTDGEYYPVSDSDDLSETFEEIAENVSTRTVYHNESYNETVLVGVEETTETVSVSESGEFDVNLSTTRSLTEAEAENHSVGDTVWVNGTESLVIDENETVSMDFTVQRFSNASNSTYTTTVSRSVEFSYQSNVTGDVNDTVVLEDRHLDTDTAYQRYLLHPQATLTVETGGDAATLWDGRNLNNWTADGVTLDAFESEDFSLADGEETSFEPTFRECIANETTGGTVTIGGADYQQTYCTAAGSTMLGDSETEVHIYANNTQILANSSLAWQESLREMLDTPDGQYYRETPTGELYADLPCENQALVVVEATDNESQTDANNMVFLADVGQCSENVEMSYLVGVDVSVVSTTENSTRVLAGPPVPSVDASALLSADASVSATASVHAPARERAA